MQIAVLGIDLGKNSCSLVGLDQNGAVVKRRRMPGSRAATVRSCARRTALSMRLTSCTPFVVNRHIFSRRSS